ncbi:MAG: polyprenyl synthetase family protein [Bacteroidales bacterium]|nr:polyprenyl synthetase family protein [Bacteroidales bacterium]
MVTLKEISALIDQGIANLPIPAKPEGLYGPIRYTMESGGKRLRPTLLLTCAAACGGDIKKSLPQALGLEMFHNFTLLHDDVMDNAEVRRGRPTVHRRWNRNTAILSGDAMLTLASQLMGDCDKAILPEVMSIFNKTALEVYEGQQLDMDYESRLDVTIPEYIDMIRLKTSVLLACACRMGVLTAGGSEKLMDDLYEYGESLGIAFQLQDDYLDTFGDPLVFGKETGGDILNEKKTWLWISACNEDESGVMQEAIAGKYNEDDKVKNVREVYRRLELDKRIVDLIGVYSNMALDALSRTGLGHEEKEILTGLTRSLATRVN